MLLVSNLLIKLTKKWKFLYNPVKKLSLKFQETFKDCVDRILSITKDDNYLQNPKKQAKVKTLEEEIDQLVYKLYDLTPEEIKIVEGKNENAD